MPELRGVCVCYTHPYMSLQRKLVKNLMDPTFEKGSSGQFQEWSAARGIPIHTLGRNIGDRFFGTFFASAQLVTLQDDIRSFLQGQIDASQPKDKSSMRTTKYLLEWVNSHDCKVFWFCSTVLHACWCKQVIQNINAKQPCVIDAFEPWSKFGILVALGGIQNCCFGGIFHQMPVMTLSLPHMLKNVTFSAPMCVLPPFRTFFFGP